jgi:glycosyltransferase A (GT-A) superfamily protein (DUF2064 family)
MRALVEDPTIELVAQPESDLGGRMAAALDWARRGGSTRSVVLGADCPSLDRTVVDRALALLDERDVVVGPAVDGGYYLIGASGPVPPRLFAGLSWSTPQVLSETLGRLDGASLALVEMWYDVDTPGDVRLLAAHLDALEAAGTPRAVRTHAALRAVLSTTTR